MCRRSACADCARSRPRSEPTSSPTSFSPAPSSPPPPSTPSDPGPTSHIRERQPDGLLLGVFLDDRRDPKEQTTILAEQGKIVQNSQGTFLFLQTGNVQRHLSDERDPNIVLFERYAFDL